MKLQYFNTPPYCYLLSACYKVLYNILFENGVTYLFYKRIFKLNSQKINRLVN